MMNTFFLHLKHQLSSKRQALLCLLGLSIVVAFDPVRVSAQGNLLVTPRRVVFENAAKIQELSLANIGTDTAKYMISVMEIRMKEDGSFEQISQPDSGQLFASANLRIYPRTVTVAPGESQLVKVQLIKSEQLAAGEYRSHIYIRSVPDEKPLGEKDEKVDTTGISVKLKAIFGISIPAIVRVGDNDTKVTLAEPKLIANTDGKAPKLDILLNRAGKMSSYGDMTVECISPNGKVTQVGLVRGIAVYTPNVKRHFVLDLNNAEGVDYKTGKLHIVYKTQKDAKVQDASEAELPL